jgi:hypothetical protein
MLLPLADNGGSTPTMALRPYSPCINTGLSGTASYILDQRGTSRNRIAEIGAFEYTGPFNNSFVVNTTAMKTTAAPTRPTAPARASARHIFTPARPRARRHHLRAGLLAQVIQVSRNELRLSSGNHHPRARRRSPDDSRLGPQTEYASSTLLESPVTPSVGPVEISGLTVTNGKVGGIADCRGDDRARGRLRHHRQRPAESTTPEASSP